MKERKENLKTSLDEMNGRREGGVRKGLTGRKKQVKKERIGHFPR